MAGLRPPERAFGQLEYLTPPEHVHDKHIEHAWAKANERVAARLADTRG